MAQLEVSHPFLVFILLVFFSLSAIYLIAFTLFRKAWLRIPELKINTLDNASKTSVSIVVALRNEEESIPSLIDNFSAQIYPPELFDIILVDDHSDLSVKTQLPKPPPKNLIVLSLDNGITGKKEALIEGVKASKSELILFTDADCKVGPNWVASHVHHHNIKGCTMNIGLVDYCERNTWHSGIFRLDFLSMVITGASMAELGHPAICNGANLAVKRETFLNLRESLNNERLSGDDVFLLHAHKREPNHNISVLKSQKNIVYTQAPTSITSFLNQRSRWASKSGSYTDWDTILLSLLIFVFNLAIVLCSIGVILGYYSWIYIALILVVKTMADIPLLAAGLKFFTRKKHLALLPIFQLVYPFYICTAALMGFLKLYRWKGRSE